MSKEPTFYFYFSENMKGLGLPAPESLFGGATAAVGTITALLTLVDKYGTHASVQTVIVSGGAAGAAGGAVSGALRALHVVGAVAASFYVGACIGSLIVATHKKVDSPINWADIIHILKRHNIEVPKWLSSVYGLHPGIINRGPIRYKIQGAQ